MNPMDRGSYNIDKKLAALVIFGSLALYFIDVKLSAEIGGAYNIHVHQNTSVSWDLSFNPIAIVIWSIKLFFLFAMFLWVNFCYTVNKASPMALYVFMMVIGGAANAMSALVYGVIFDYIPVFKWGDAVWSCNVADIAVTCGFLGYMYEIFKQFRRMI